jgi:CheY-like chemotaxis protein
MTALGETRPDLVLLDIMMPRKSGINVYNEMKSEPSLAKIPIIVVTGASETTGVSMRTGEKTPGESYGDDLARGLGSALYDRLKNLTPDGLLEKPIEPQLLIKTINGLL